MIKFEMQDTEVDVSLTFYQLYQLKNKHPEEYKKYFSFQKNGIHSDLDAAEMIYIAYLCAHMDKMPDVMSLEEFLQKMKNSRKRVWDTVTRLTIDEKN